MRINLLELLEDASAQWPDQTAYADETSALTFREVYDRARAAGSFLLSKDLRGEPVLVCTGRSPETVAAYWGVVCAGCSYVPIDEDTPPRRVRQIIETIQPCAAFCGASGRDLLSPWMDGDAIHEPDSVFQTLPDNGALAAVRARAIDLDPVYTVFTSGSTGVPKGVTACHRNVLDYADSLTEALGFDADTVFGVQAPLGIDACLKELVPTLLVGAKSVLIPKSLFLFPLKLAEFLNEYKINTLCWAASALTMLSAYGALEEEPPRFLHTVAFGGETPPPGQLCLWRAALPNARLFNLYGPTEATGMSCCYELPKVIQPDKPVPIGKPLRNTALLLLDEAHRLTLPDESAPSAVGEIYLRGAGLTLGYWGDPEQSARSFAQNPLHNRYRDPVYRTGDLARYGADGELVFVSRRDHQVKHMGRRVELGEIEAAAQEAEGVARACCAYHPETQKFTLFYEGPAAPAALAAHLRRELPRYMQPHAYQAMDTLPVTASGKIDREQLTMDN